MNTKKLIGTIIGVTLFAVLIAGATFAWLTFGTTVGDGVYQGQTMNFVVNYTGGTKIENLPMLDSKLATPDIAQEKSVSAKKNSGSANGHLSITLKTDSTNTLSSEGVIRWAICRENPCSTNFDNALNAGIVKPGAEIVLLNDAALADGQTCTGISSKIKNMVLPTYNGADKATRTLVDSNTYSVCPTLSRDVDKGSSVSNYLIGNGNLTDTINYYIYLWYDGESLKNSHIDQSYGGYIGAAAVQINE